MRRLRTSTQCKRLNKMHPSSKKRAWPFCTTIRTLGPAIDHGDCKSLRVRLLHDVDIWSPVYFQRASCCCSQTLSRHSTYHQSYSNLNDLSVLPRRVGREP